MWDWVYIIAAWTLLIVLAFWRGARRAFIPRSIWIFAETNRPALTSGVLSIVLSAILLLLYWYIEEILKILHGTDVMSLGLSVLAKIGDPKSCGDLMEKCLRVEFLVKRFLWAALAAAVVSYCLVRLRSALFDFTSDKVERSEAAARDGVIMALSHLDRRNLWEDYLHHFEGANLETLCAKGGVERVLRDRAYITEETPGPFGFFPWQQNLRIIDFHLRVRRAPRHRRTLHVVLVPTQESEALKTQFERLVHSLELGRGLDAKLDIIIHAVEPVDDAEGVDGYKRAFQSAVALLRDEALLRNREISIDVTSGTKTSSVAGAAISFGGAIQFTYVGADGVVEAYDVKVRLRA